MADFTDPEVTVLKRLAFSGRAGNLLPVENESAARALGRRGLVQRVGVGVAGSARWALTAEGICAVPYGETGWPSSADLDPRPVPLTPDQRHHGVRPLRHLTEDELHALVAFDDMANHLKPEVAVPAGDLGYLASRELSERESEGR